MLCYPKKFTMSEFTNVLFLLTNRKLPGVQGLGIIKNKIKCLAFKFAVICLYFNSNSASNHSTCHQLQ